MKDKKLLKEMFEEDEIKFDDYNPDDVPEDDTVDYEDHILYSHDDDIKFDDTEEDDEEDPYEPTGYENDAESLLKKIAKSLGMPFEAEDRGSYDDWNYESFAEDYRNGKGDEWVEDLEEEGLDDGLLQQYKKLVGYHEDSELKGESLKEEKQRDEFFYKWRKNLQDKYHISPLGSIGGKYYIHVAQGIDPSGHFCAGYRDPTEKELDLCVKEAESLGQKAEIVDKDHIRIIYNECLTEAEEHIADEPFNQPLGDEE